MSKTQRTITTVLWGLLVLAMVGVISARLFVQSAPPPIATGHASPVVLDFDAPQFSLINQDGQPITTQSLKGSVWIADFIFTSCAGPCPEMSRKMQAMQKQIPDSDVKFISISVDPDHDTPAVLKSYAQSYGPTDRWSLLTGDKSAIYGVAKDMMLNLKPGTENTPLEHSERFILVDAAGKVRSTYESYDPEAMTRLIDDAKELAAAARKSTAK